jgi:hypothetical protein
MIQEINLKQVALSSGGHLEPLVGWRFAYRDRHCIKDTIIMSYNARWGSAHFQNRLWMAEWNGEVEDYGSRRYLINSANKEKHRWIVLRVHKGMMCTIIEKG